MKRADPELQNKLLEMLHWFHALCVDNGLRYYALGGTMLGAVRHGGFIPWDDDIDVGMPRRDYERLFDAVSRAERTHYVLETPTHSGEDFFYCYAKLYDTETTLVENKKNRIRRGIYLDIFPLDGMGDTEEESRKQFGRVDRRFKFFLARTTGLRKGRDPLKNAAVVVSRLIPDALLNDRKLLLRIDALSAQRDFDDCLYGGNPYGAWRGREIMPRAIMGTPALYRFEDMEVYGAQDADAYLTRLYGDWRQLPPEEKRVSHHDNIEYDLNRSYLEP
ncbi:MAG: LicD family protein [Oscillospiraceae bacterium]|nr:LicD family protein [Oscillospiraceae bacterium]